MREVPLYEYEVHYDDGETDIVETNMPPSAVMPEDELEELFPGASRIVYVGRVA